MKKKTVIILSSVVVLALVSAFFFFRPHSKNSLAQYDFSPVSPMNLSEEVDATGKVLALEKKEVYPDFDGTVEQINTQAGASVKQGDPLLTIKSTSLNSQWQQANTALKQAKINLSQASAELATELALNKVTKNNALQIETYSHQISLYKSQVKQAEKELNDLNARNDGVYASGNGKLVIRAPFNGQVAWVDVTEGDRITPQTRLVTVTKPNALGVEAQIDQNDISLIKIGQRAEIIGKDQAQTGNMGKVTEISSQGQSSLDNGLVNASATSATSEIINFPVRIQLDGSTQGLRPGMSVDVTVLAVEHPDALAVPAGSVIHDNGKDLVRVRKGDQVIPVAVKLGLKSGKYWEVLSGLHAGDQVAIPKPPALKQPGGLSGGGPRMGGSPFGR